MVDAHTNPHGDHGGLSSRFKYLLHFGDYWSSPVNNAVLEMVQLQPQERVLDIGAGMGPATVAASSLLPKGQIIAVEPSAFMRWVLGIRRLWHRRRRRIHVMNGTAESIPLADESVDAAWAINSMHHWADHKVAVDEILRVLRPGGRVLLLDENFDHPEHRLYKPGQSNPHAMPSPENLADLLNIAGYSKVTATHSTVAGDPVLLLQGTKPPLGPFP